MLLLIGLAGCTAEGAYKTTGPTAPLQPSYDSVKVVINASAPQSPEIVPDLRSAIVGQLISMGRFRRVVGENEPADLVVKLDIINYQRVTVVDRLLVGVFAGRNRITCNVSVTDGKNGTVIRAFEAAGASAAHPLSSEAGYADALREVAKQTALGLR